MFFESWMSIVQVNNRQSEIFNSPEFCAEKLDTEFW